MVPIAHSMAQNKGFYWQGWVGVCLFLFSMSSLARPKGVPYEIQVVGGTEVEESSSIRGSTVHLHIEDRTNQKWLCTGSVISDSLIMTAAHCLESDPSFVMITFANNPNASRGWADDVEYRLGQRYLIHQDYESEDENTRNDLGLIYFEGGLPDGVLPARLYAGRLDPQNYPSVVLAGFGTTEFDQETDNILRKAELKIIREVGKNIELQHPELKSSACQGDSGGPAFIIKNSQYWLLGVSSYVDEPFCHHSSFYTNLLDYADWLQGASQRMMAAPKKIPTTVFTQKFSAQELEALEAQLNAQEFDSQRLEIVQDRLQKLEAKVYFNAEDVLQILMPFSLDENRMEALKLISGRISLTSPRQANLLSKMFKYEYNQAEALKYFPMREIYYLDTFEDKMKKTP